MARQSMGRSGRQTIGPGDMRLLTRTACRRASPPVAHPSGWPARSHVLLEGHGWPETCDR